MELCEGELSGGRGTAEFQYQLLSGVHSPAFSANAPASSLSKLVLECICVRLGLVNTCFSYALLSTFKLIVIYVDLILFKLSFPTKKQKLIKK